MYYYRHDCACIIPNSKPGFAGQVKNFISLGGPNAGTASVPLCGVSLNLLSSCKDAFCLLQYESIIQRNSV